MDALAEWRTPHVVEHGRTVADARRIVRLADDVWFRVKDGGPYGTAAVCISKRAVLQGLRFKRSDDPLAIKFYIACGDGLAGSAWIGDDA